MSRQFYDRDLRRLENDLQTLGNMTQESVLRSVDMIERQDREGAQQLIRYDEQVNARRYQIEGDVLTLIATQAPVAGDVRALAAMLEIAGELERIGDYAKGIAAVHLKMPVEIIDARVLRLWHEMADIDASMMARGLDAFDRRDEALAAEVIADDDRVDALFNDVFRRVIAGGSLREESEEREIELANYVLWITHNLERTGDRATNICERVRYMITGLMAPQQDAV
jgi:phosphate transport system protein